MATQKYRSRFDHTVGENEGTTRPVHPARPELPVKAGAENRTPAPTKTYDPTMKDKTWGRESGNPGGNAYSGASSIMPGQKAPAATINPQAPTDVLLDNIIRGGTARGSDGDDYQTRSLTDPHDNPKGRVPVHPNMTGPSPGGTVPAKCGTNK